MHACMYVRIGLYGVYVCNRKNTDNGNTKAKREHTHDYEHLNELPQYISLNGFGNPINHSITSNSSRMHQPSTSTHYYTYSNGVYQPPALFYFRPIKHAESINGIKEVARTVPTTITVGVKSELNMKRSCSAKSHTPLHAIVPSSEYDQLRTHEGKSTSNNNTTINHGNGNNGAVRAVRPPPLRAGRPVRAGIEREKGKGRRNKRRKPKRIFTERLRTHLRTRKARHVHTLYPQTIHTIDYDDTPSSSIVERKPSDILHPSSTIAIDAIDARKVHTQPQSHSRPNLRVYSSYSSSLGLSNTNSSTQANLSKEEFYSMLAMLRQTIKSQKRITGQWPRGPRAHAHGQA